MNIQETDVAFSSSILWDLQRKYFQKAGTQAWITQTVPLYVTNNPALARSYAAILAAWMADLNTPESLLFIVELGAGTGRFSFLVLRQLELLLSPKSPDRFRYVLTDFAECNVSFCRDHPQLQPFRERGWLDFAVFDAERDASLTLLDSGIEIHPGSLHAPVLVIANYVFDGLRNDVFRARDGEVSELRLTVESEEATLSDVEAAREAVFKFRDSSTNLGRYTPAWRSLVEKHAQRSNGQAFLFPKGTLECLDRLRRLTSAPLTLLACDQFRGGEGFLDSEGTPKISFHGSFSVPVNFPIIRDYFEASGGFGVLPSFNYSGVVPFAARTHATSAGLRREISRSFEAIGPDLLFTIRRTFETHFRSMPAAGILSLLRVTGFDPYVLEHAIPSLQEHVTLAMPIEPESRNDLLEVIDACWANYYGIGEPCDLPRRLALLLYGIGEFQRALDFFSEERRMRGTVAENAWNTGLCLFGLNRLEEAFGYFAKARQVSKEFTPACLSASFSLSAETQ